MVKLSFEGLIPGGAIVLSLCIII